MKCATICLLVTIWLQLALLTAGGAALSLPALQLLEALGLPSHTLESITPGEQRRPHDSPIYYIKMPPNPANSPPLPPNLPYSNSIDLQHQEFGDFALHTSTKSPFEQVPVDFTNNGRPEHVYHWSRPSGGPLTSWSHSSHLPPPALSTQSKPSFSSSKSTSSPSATTLSTTTPSTTAPSTTASSKSTQKPFKLPSIAPWPPAPSKTPTKKPWASFVKEFSSNAKPSGVYIYKSKPVRKQHKHRHPLFRHFNY